MPLEPTVVQQIKENLSSFTKLELKGVSDKDIKQVVTAFPKDSHICDISIESHHLTSTGYRLLLILLKNHPQIISFYCEDMSSSTLSITSIALYNKAFNDLIDAHIAAAKQKTSAKIQCNVQANPVDQQKVLVFTQGSDPSSHGDSVKSSNLLPASVVPKIQSEARKEGELGLRKATLQ